MQFPKVNAAVTKKKSVTQDKILKVMKDVVKKQKVVNSFATKKPIVIFMLGGPGSGKGT